MCNEENYQHFDFSHYSSLESLSIGNNSFSFVQTFQIDGLNRLKAMIIGVNSFTLVKGGPWSYMTSKQKSFHIMNCESLRSIQIGQYSFYDFAGDFELKNLPQLQSLQIGTIGRWSGNFKSGSFVIQGIYLMLHTQIIRSSKFAIPCFR